jgi:hypothetical protein
VYPPSEIFAKLVNKNTLKRQKGVPSPKNFYNPFIPSLPKFGKNLIDPPSGFSKPCASMLGDYNNQLSFMIIMKKLSNQPSFLCKVGHPCTRQPVFKIIFLTKLSTDKPN